MIKKVDSLESNVKVLNDRVNKQDDEIVVLKLIVDQQKNREKREIKSTSLCSIKACAFDTKRTSSSVAKEKPANCEDLKSIGHTLNGFYLVQGKIDDKIPQIGSKVETIYCDFNKRQSSENLAGNMTNINKKIIYLIDCSNNYLIFINIRNCYGKNWLH